MAEAPRFHAYFCRVENRSVLTMKREAWNHLRGSFGFPVELSLDQTPLRGVATDAEVVAARAHRSSSASCEIEIVRFDEADAPTPFNVDRYTVYEDMTSHESFSDIVRGGSTEDNENLRQYLTDHVFIVRQDPGPDHWLPGLPASATTVIRST